jgi:peptidyl-prolyl cis-trans isomerase C
MKRLLREPLVHFLLIGAVLFGLYSATQSGRPATAASKEIRLSVDEIAQLTLLYQSQWRRPPTPQELARMVENKVQQEILYREALAMGLDKDDEIVKRRMAQKMQFLAEDVAAAREPTMAELRGWFEKNSGKFAQPPRLSFRHLYFSPDRRGPRAREDAQQALAKLAGSPVDAKIAGSLADPFMFQEYYRDRAPEFLGKEMGPQFALAVAKLTPGSWQGPVESGFGWHLATLVSLGVIALVLAVTVVVSLRATPEDLVADAIADARADPAEEPDP